MEMSAEEIETYIATGEPLQCAGSFTIDGYGGAFIRKVDGDPHTVVGLSISTLRALLGQANVGITELWTGRGCGPGGHPRRVTHGMRRGVSQFAALCGNPTKEGPYTRGIRK